VQWRFKDTNCHERCVREAEDDRPFFSETGSEADSSDDVASQAAKAGGKAAAVVVDETAITPRYVVGFPTERDLPKQTSIGSKSFRYCSGEQSSRDFDIIGI
jgi:hypothetical protein